MSGKMSRDKGYRAENNLVKLLTAAGFNAKRVPLSGGTNYQKGDVIIETELNRYVVEVKCREGLSNKLWSWLDENDWLVLKKNNKPYLLVTNLEKSLERWKE